MPINKARSGPAKLFGPGEVKRPAVSPNKPDDYDGRANTNAGETHDPGASADWNGQGYVIETE